MSNNLLYYSILTTIAIKSLSFFPILINDTYDIPYETIILNMFSTFVLILIALFKRYFVQLLFFVILEASLIAILLKKYELNKFNH